MNKFLALLAFLSQLALPVERVSIPTPDGVALNAALVRPHGPPLGPAVILLHGCGGPGRRDSVWAKDLARSGHIVLLPDSFGSRGLGSQCHNKANTITPVGPRRQDAIAAAQWLAALPGTPPGGMVLLGFSHGGSTVLWTARQTPDLPAALFRGFIAFYPQCGPLVGLADYHPSTRLLLLIGAEDHQAPAAPCRDFAARFPGQVDFTVYPGADHDFDFIEDGTGSARTGGNPVAAADAHRRVNSYLDALSEP